MWALRRSWSCCRLITWSPKFRSGRAPFALGAQLRRQVQHDGHRQHVVPRAAAVESDHGPGTERDRDTRRALLLGLTVGAVWGLSATLVGR
jgi:hypothetical protein